MSHSVTFRATHCEMGPLAVTLDEIATACLGRPQWYCPDHEAEGRHYDSEEFVEGPQEIERRWVAARTAARPRCGVLADLNAGERSP